MKHAVRQHHEQAHGKRNEAHHGKGGEHARDGRQYQKRCDDTHEVEAGASLALQALGLNVRATDQVTARSAVRAGVSHVGDAHLVAIMRAGGKLNRLLGGHTDTAAAIAIGARVGNDLAGTAALRTTRLERARTKQEGQVDIDRAATTAARSGVGMP